MSEAMRNRLPLGTSHFAHMRARGQIYVDKTEHMESLLSSGGYNFMLCRPRQFGKSVLVSALHSLFTRARDDDFKGLAIHESGFIQRVPHCPVLRLDMAEVQASTSADERVLEANLDAWIRRQARALGFEPDAEWKELGPSYVFEDLLRHLHKTHGQRVAILVENYDAPLLALLGSRAPVSDEAKDDARRELHAFYSVIKHSSEHIEFALLTGLAWVDLVASPFSGFNNYSNISGDARYAAICGFTESELERYLGDHLARAAAHYGCSVPELQADLRRYYGGYHFARYGEPLYNPTSVLKALHRLVDPAAAQALQAQGFPQEWPEQGVLPFFRVLQEQGRDLSRYESEYASRMWSPYDFLRVPVDSLMFQTGLLTFQKGDDDHWRLRYPNLEVRNALRAAAPS